MRTPEKIYGIPLLSLLFATFLILSASASQARERMRIEPKIPDIPGYLTLKCDFHMHTVFSDGQVWPTVRVEEAWRDGLDALAITDHLEYQPHKDDLKKDLNRSYEIALPGANALGLLLIKGSEITKQVPPGHFNALFLKDSSPLEHENYLDCIKAAIDQGAFVFWNHPPFRQKNEQSIWHPEHTVVYEKGWLYGIEIANGTDYYPEAHRWCLEKKLTMLGDTDIHQPISFDYDPERGDRRTMTLVFAKSRTEEAIKEALFARRTAVYVLNSLYGEKQFLEPLFKASIEIKNPEIKIKGKGGAGVQVKNRSDIPFRLVADSEVDGLEIQRKITLEPDAVVILSVRGKAENRSGTEEVRLPYRVENLRPTPEEGLPVTLNLRVTFEPGEKK